MTHDMQQRQQTPQRPRLVRPTGSRQLAGVASGLAEHFGISAGWLRFGFIVLTFTGGLGIVLYILGWLLIPEEGERRSVAEHALDGSERNGSWLAVALVTVAAIIALGSLNFIAGELLLAAGLFFVGLLLYRGDWPRTSRDGDTSPVSPPADNDPYMAAARAEVDEIGDPLVLGPTVPEPDPYRPPQRPARHRSYLGRLTLAAALIAVGALAVLDSLDILAPSIAQYGAVVLAVIGGGLVIGAFAGRALWLIVPGLVLLPIILVANFINLPFTGSFGEFDIRPTTGAALESSYDFGGADVTIDLQDLPPLTVDRIVTVDMGAGQLVIVVPDDLNVVVDAEVAAGEIVVDRAFGAASQEGVLVDQRFASIATDDPVLELQVDVGFGTVQIEPPGG